MDMTIGLMVVRSSSGCIVFRWMEWCNLDCSSAMRRESFVQPLQTNLSEDAPEVLLFGYFQPLHSTGCPNISDINRALRGTCMAFGVEEGPSSDGSG